jgi:hypothetical protein
MRRAEGTEVTDEPTLATLTNQLAEMKSELAMLRISSSLRTCLVPACLRQYDSTTHMLGRPPVRPEWSGQGWHKVTRGVANGDLCPDHVDIVTAHLPRTIDLPNGRWTVLCACGWETTPRAWDGLLRPLWEQHLLTVMGTLPEPPAHDETLERVPLAHHTEATLTELYDALDDTEYDRRETREAAQAMFRAWDWHRNTLGGVSRAVVAICNQMRVNSRDWAADRGDAYLWAVLIGWDDDALQEVAAKHRWNEHRVKYVREMRALLAPITDPQPKED